MPTTLTERFDALDDNLKLNPADRARAEAAHGKLGDALIKAGIAKKTRLQGSFARKTMLPPLHDVDKVIELVDVLGDTLDSPGGSTKAMRLIRDVVTDAFPGATFEVKKHALGIVLPGDDFDFDAVPAFNTDDGSGWIRIADTENDRWEPSNTYVLIEVISTRNQACDGRFVRQVRMVKQAAKEAGIDIPGLHVETFAYRAATERMPHADAVAATFRAAAEMLRGAYNDPTDVDRIDDRLTDIQRRDAQDAFSRLAADGNEALRLAEAGDEDGAARIWGSIFGDAFPKPTDKDFLTDLNRGLGLASVGRVTDRTPTPRTRPWRL